MSAGPRAVPEPVPDLPEPSLPLKVLRGGARVAATFRGAEPLDADRLMDAARRRTGLDDWGNAHFEPALRRFVRDWRERADLSELGRFVTAHEIRRVLETRLSVRRHLTEHPEVEDRPVEAPVVIVGLPRTGTTMLHHLLSRIPGSRTPRTWEMRRPLPPPDATTGRADPRVARTERELSLLLRISPALRHRHLYGADDPEDCFLLLRNSFHVFLLRAASDLPDYLGWLLEQDLTQTYRELRAQLQILQSQWPGSPWVLKSPGHLFALDALLRVFPDARVVWTHRDPRDAVPSFCSYAAAARQLTAAGPPRRDRYGPAMLGLLSEGARRGLEARERMPAGHPVVDVSYDALTRDPLATVRRIHHRLGLEWGERSEAAVADWVEANPKDRNGRHRYSLEQFGLDRRIVERSFGPYMRVAVPEAA